MKQDELTNRLMDEVLRPLLKLNPDSDRDDEVYHWVHTIVTDELRDMPNDPLSLMIREAQDDNPLFPGVFHTALDHGLKAMYDERDEWLEKNKDERLWVEPNLWHRLIGEAKKRFDDLYS